MYKISFNFTFRFSNHTLRHISLNCSIIFFRFCIFFVLFYLFFLRTVIFILTTIRNFDLIKLNARLLLLLRKLLKID